MVSALLLKRTFAEIIILERQSKRRLLSTRGFTFPIVLSPSARSVLRDVGVLGAIDAERSPYFGVVAHKRFLGREWTWTARRADVYSHWRNHIMGALYDRVTEEGIRVVFDAQLEDIDFDVGSCREAELGEISFDLLLGADGMYSQTRSLMARSHHEFAEEEFWSEVLDRWYAYRLPSDAALDERYGASQDGVALHVHTDNLKHAPNEKFRIITVAMTSPQREVSVVIKHAADLKPERLKQLNADFFGGLVESETLEREWNSGVGGEYRHVHAPAFSLGKAVLVGDAAHGFEGNGDLINLGIVSVAELSGVIRSHDTLSEALNHYDATVGERLRTYSHLAMRRSLEKIYFEVAAYELGALLRINGHHPSLWGIYEDTFDICTYMDRYQRIRMRNRLVAGTLATAGALLATRGFLRRSKRHA